MKKAVFLFLMICTVCLHAQVLSYEIFVFDKKIGLAEVERKFSGDTVYYTLRSATSSTFFFVTRRTQQYFTVAYKGGQLIKADAISKMNEETNITHLRWTGTTYTIKRNAKTFAVDGAVKYSTLPMYFKEPADNQQVFSERMGEFFNAKKNDAGSYEYTLSDGIKNIFKYGKGVPVLIQMKKSFVTVEMRLVGGN